MEGLTSVEEFQALLGVPVTPSYGCGCWQLRPLHGRSCGNCFCTTSDTTGRTIQSSTTGTSNTAQQNRQSLESRREWVEAKLQPRKIVGTCKGPSQLVFEHGAGHNESRRMGWCASQVMKFCEEGQLSEAVKVLNLLVQRGSDVDSSIFYALLKRCIANKDLVLGSHVHALVIEGGYDSNAFLANHIICMYASHGRLEEARETFMKVDTPNIYMWASIILAHARHGQPTEAIELYRQMRQSPVKPDTRTFVAVLKACATAQDVSFGRELHADILKNADNMDIFVGNGLVDMYSKCGRLEDARAVFDNLPTRDVVSWTAMIAGYARHGLGEEALNLYSCMQQEGIIQANHVTFVCLLQACARIGAVHLGKHMHAQILERRLEADLLVGTCLVDMYAKCGYLEDARKVFDHLPRKNLVTWNAMIAGYAQHGLGFRALTLYEQMKHQCTTSADSITFVCLLQACASVGALHEGKQVHAQIQERGLEADVTVSNCLVNMYAKCGSLEHAHRVFDNMQIKDVVTWNAMIAGYAHHGYSEEALALYGRMKQEGIIPADPVTFICLLQACGSVAGLRKGTEIHGEISKTGLEATDVSVANALIDMYVKCGSLEIARKVFDNLLVRDIITWTTIIAGYAQHGLGEDALTLYGSMRQYGISPADCVTFACLLQVCASVKALHQGKQLHAEVRERGLETDVVVGTCLVDMYAKCGSLEIARKVFDNMQNKNVVTWTAILTGYSQHGLGQETLSLYESMQAEDITPANAVTFVSLLQACASVGALQQGKQLHAQIEERGLEADVVVGTSLVDMFAKCGCLENARKVFDSLPSKNVVTWNAMIAGYVQHGLGGKALTLYASMQGEGMAANSITFVVLLQACGTMAALEMGREIHAEILMMGIEATDPLVANALMDMYGKCGDMVDAQQVFDALPVRDVVTWSALIAGYSHHGESMSVFDLFSRMRQEGIQPDGITFLSILSVCSHGGLLDEGQKYFEAMSRDYGISPTMEHYTCMVDLLGRAGHVDLAMEMIKTMPCKPNGKLWRCVLGACQKWGDVELGKQAFQCALRLDEDDGAAYVLMSNIFAGAQMWEDREDIHAMRLKAQARKQAGESWWTDFSGTVHTFTVGASRHAKWEHIDSKLRDLFVKIQEECTSCELYDNVDVRKMVTLQLH